MRIVILSRGPFLYSTQSLHLAARKRGHAVTVLDHTDCTVVVRSGSSVLLNEGNSIQGINGIIPRIGPSVTNIGASIIQHLVSQGAISVVSADGLLRARDKFQCLQQFAEKDIAVPKSALVGSLGHVASIVELLGGFPIVLKLQGLTHGNGVLLMETLSQLQSTMEAFLHLRQQVLLQEYIKEANGVDIRALVVGDKVVAAMERKAKEGEFRANLHQGGVGSPVELTKRENKMAVKAARFLGLEVAGVDFLRSSKGPLVLEVNASPGLEGIEKVTGVNVSDKIILRLEELIRTKRIRYEDTHP